MFPVIPMHFTWIRKDWLDKLNLKEPSSLEELLEIAEAFKITTLMEMERMIPSVSLCDQRVAGIYNSIIPWIPFSAIIILIPASG